MPINDEDADRMAQALTREVGRNIWRGCGIVLAIFLIGSAAIWVVLMLR